MITLAPGTKLRARYSLPEFNIVGNMLYQVGYHGDRVGIRVLNTVLYLDNLMEDELKVFGL